MTRTRVVAVVVAGAASFLALASLAAPDGPRRITVAAGQHDRKDTPVAFPLAGASGEVLALRGPQGGPTPLQVDGNGIAWFVLDELKAGQAREYSIEAGSPGAAAAMSASKDGDIVRVIRAGRPVFEYRGGRGCCPPATCGPPSSGAAISIPCRRRRERW